MARPTYDDREIGKNSKVAHLKTMYKNPWIKLELHCHRFICPPGVPPVSRVSMQESIPILVKLKHFRSLWVAVPTDLNSGI